MRDVYEGKGTASRKNSLGRSRRISSKSERHDQRGLLLSEPKFVSLRVVGALLPGKEMNQENENEEDEEEARAVECSSRRRRRHSSGCRKEWNE